MHRSTFRTLTVGAWAILLGNLCAASFEAAAANPVHPAPVAGAPCPSHDINKFVAAFAESPALQEQYSAASVDMAFIEGSSEPEPRETVEHISREKLRFPIMPNRTQQAAQGLRYRYISADDNRAVIALEVPDTDAQSTYAFQRSGCWMLVKIVDPAFGKAAQRDVSVNSSVGRVEPALATNDDYEVSPGLSATFAACIQRAQFQAIARADCLTNERNRQDARLNRTYKHLVAILQGNQRARLVEAQSTWVRLQQQNGAFEAAILDDLGSIGSMQSLENEARAIAQRADLIERYLELSKL